MCENQLYGIVLERENSDLCQMTAVDELFAYGNSFLEKKEYKKAMLCFEKCFELEPMNLDICEWLIYENFQAGNHQRMFELLELLINSKKPHYHQDGNFYLYLFSMFMDLPDSYKKQVENFTFEDIKVLSTDTRYQNIEIQNRVRLIAFQDRFPLAHKLFFGNVKDLNQPQNKLTGRLLNVVCDVEIQSKNIILKLAQEKKWNAVRIYLLQKQNRHSLNFIKEETLLRLVTQYLEMKSSGDIPKSKQFKVYTSEEAIYANQYEIALQLQEQWCKKYPDDSKALVYILNDICQFVRTSECSTTLEQTFLALNHPEFSIELSHYIQQFYDALSKNEFEMARTLLDIIDRGSKREGKSTPILELFQTLSLKEKRYNQGDTTSGRLQTGTVGKQYIKQT